MAQIFPSRRVRRTAFTPGVEAAGVKGYTVYNHMLLPTVFESVEEDYRHLKSAVQLWDVACERQVELRGPDAGRLLSLISPRDVTRIAEDQCAYLPVIDRHGHMLNDPVLVPVDQDRFWISIADSDYLQYVLGVADAMGLDVAISEPDVSPLAVQGPKADDVMAAVFGDAVRKIRFFRFARLAAPGLPAMLVARSGYSKQGGFEIYVEGGEYGMPLWDILMEAGKPFDIRSGCPNLIERIEGGLLSYGNDMTRENTPFEARLGRYCDSPGDYLGRAAIEAMKAAGPGQQIRAIEIGGRVPVCDQAWPLMAGDATVGQVTSAANSPDFGCGVSIGMVASSHWQDGTQLTVRTPSGDMPARVREKFWI